MKLVKNIVYAASAFVRFLDRVYIVISNRLR